MSEVNIDTLLKRASMLEEEKDYDQALSIYNRILDNEPENEIAYRRRKAIRDNTLTIKREQFPLLGAGAVKFYFCLDGTKIDSQFFVANMAPQDYTVDKVSLGKHRISVHQVGHTVNAVPVEILGYDFEMTQSHQTLYLRYTQASRLHFSTLASEEGTKSGGCYVATAVYGSYDCPQVWTLRRFRDNTLAETWYGRAFIRTYYAISPTLVKWFGHTEWFKKMWRGKLDKMVNKLQKQGVENTPYQDRNW